MYNVQNSQPDSLPMLDPADLFSKVDALVQNGCDPRKSLTTVLFHTEGSSAHLSFKHKNYGYHKNRKDVDSRFHDHVVSDPTLWFRGTGCKDRAIAKEFQVRNDVTGQRTISAALTSRSLVMAHDVAMNTKAPEGGPKDYFLASPWQILNTLSKEGGFVEKAVQSIACIATLGNPNAPTFNPEWKTEGQPMFPWPCCSMYNLRCDSNALVPYDKREYFFTIDLDGKHCCDAQSVERKDCDDVIRTFERSLDGKPPILRIIGELIKQAFSEMEKTVSVSWHKSLGWKPSWRGYVVGAYFKNPKDAKHFVAERVMPKLDNEQNTWYNEGLFDLSSYGLGVDRCIGSAKMLSRDPNAMRFLNTSPLEVVSDLPLVEMFHRCPNEYLLTVLGWIYPNYVADQEPYLKSLDITHVAAESTKRKRSPEKSSNGRVSKVTATTKLPDDDFHVLEALVASSLASSNFAESWTGSNAVRGEFNGIPFFEIKGTRDSVFCVHNECVKDVDFPLLPQRKHTYKAHTNGQKLKFRISFVHEKHDPQKRIWLRQNCFKCGDSKFKKVCPIDSCAAQTAMKQLFSVPAGTCAIIDAPGIPEPQDLECSPLADWRDFYIDIHIARGAEDISILKI
jgi:hypothetical protein